MGAEEHLRTGNLDQALTDLQAEIRKSPSRPELRVFLFQLMCVLGQWDRAMTQLNVAAEMDNDALLMAQVYRVLLNCEALRADVFAGKRSPLILGEPLEWTVWLCEALALLVKGEVQAAAELRDKAFDAAPAVAGTVDGQAFEWIADADPRLGPVMEAVVEGKYYWVPFERIREIHIEGPENLRDVVWVSAQFVWSNGGEAVGLIPARYPGTEDQKDGNLKMARRTDWQDLGSDFFVGLGQRMLATDAAEYPLLESREIVLESDAEEGTGGALSEDEVTEHTDG